MNALLNILLISVVFLSTVDTVRSYKFYRFGKRDKDGHLIDQSLIYRGKPNDITSYITTDFMICAYVKRREYTGRIAEITSNPTVDDTEEAEEKTVMALGMNEDYMYFIIRDDEIRLYFVPSFSSWFTLCAYYGNSDTAYAGIIATVGKGTTKSKRKSNVNVKRGYKHIPLSAELEIGRDLEGYIGNFQMNRIPDDFLKDPESYLHKWGECKWSWGSYYTFDTEGWEATNMSPPCNSTNCNIWEGSAPGFTCSCAELLYGEEFPE